MTLVHLALCPKITFVMGLPMDTAPLDIARRAVAKISLIPCPLETYLRMPHSFTLNTCAITLGKLKWGEYDDGRDDRH